MQAGDLSGVIAAIVTPFDAQDRLDEAAARRIARHAIEGGVHGIMTAGGTGESPHLSREERRRITRIAVEEAAGRVPIIAGTAACSTREAIQFTQDAAEVGAVAAILTPPFYFHLPGRALFDHFALVARESSIPIVVYNNPLYTGNPLPPALIAELAQLDRVIGLKQSESDRVAPCKEALELLGLPAGRVRKPLPDVTNEERAGIRGALKDLRYQVSKT